MGGLSIDSDTRRSAAVCSGPPDADDSTLPVVSAAVASPGPRQI